MRLYISDQETLTSFDLPEKVDESFLFSYTPVLTNIETFINIYESKGKWCFKNDSSINLNSIVDKSVELEENNYYKLNIKGANYQFYLFSLPTFSKNSIILPMNNITKITIGTASSCDIIIHNELTKPIHAEVVNINGIWSLNAKEDFVYINNIRVEDTKHLEIGDVVFICGIKMIWMRTFIKLSGKKEAVEISNRHQVINELAKEDNSKYVDNSNDNDVSIYSENDYFFHKPRLKPVNEQEKVTIDPSPQSFGVEEVPFLLSLGTSFGLIAFSIISGYSAIDSLISNDGSKTGAVLKIVTCVTSLIGSLVMPKLLRNYQKKRVAERDEKRTKKYNLYLDKKISDINGILKKQTQNIFDSNPSSKECYNDVIGNKTRLWERENGDNDFLKVRIGLGNVYSSLEIETKSEEFSLDTNEINEKIRMVVEKAKYLRNVPITFSFTDNFISAIVCNSKFSKQYLDGIILQLITLQSPKDLKIVFLTSDKNAHKWSYLKLLPNCRSADNYDRYFATNEEEAKKVIQNLETIYNERKQQLSTTEDEINNEVDKEVVFSNFYPYYLIITDNYRKYKNIKFITDLLNFKTNLGFSFIIAEDSMRNIPYECEKFVYIAEKDSCIFEKEFSKQRQTNFITEYEENLDMYKVVRTLSNIPVQASDEIFSLPQTLSFLEMYNVGKIEQLNILNKWNTSNPIVSLQTPIGVTESGDLFKLDLHEKAHGPHGLIAGSTGSGKSEFIITYILSMAINYNPNEVQFVLIDYKGGGLAGAFENKEKNISIPHLAGTITNLDTAEINRTLSSIQSELKRRQIKFNELRDSIGESTIDIYKYQKYYREGMTKEPIPHLFIISDEFAELKAQQPDFMNELISISRIGRSLGVHLILATQKPAGVVNDQIWSNARFKICLKVQTKSDSQEMLKRPEAASIKETGRFYLQVGYDELFELGQSAWAGAKYVPTDKVIKKIDDAVMFVDNTGSIIKSSNNLVVKDKNENIGDQLTNIVKYINDIANESKITRKKLWLDSIPQEIFLQDVELKYNYKALPFLINPAIGEYDNPSGQTQGLLTLNISENGNTLIYGMQGSGKENLITTIITSICMYHSSEEVNIYIVDFGSEALKMFKDFPQVGDIILSDDGEKFANLFLSIRKEIERRKDLFADYMGSYEAYIKDSGKTLPMIICIINQYDNLLESYPTITDDILGMLKDGNKYGIVFIITTSNPTSVRTRVAQMFNSKISLQLSDVAEYRYLIDSDRGQIPSKIFGRGLVKLNSSYEFQTAYIAKRDEIYNKVKLLSTELANKYDKKAPNVSVMPEHLLASKVVSEKISLDEVPVGISKAKLKMINYDFSKYNVTPIISSNIEPHMPFVYGLVEVLKNVKDVKIRVIDVLGVFRKSLGIDLFNNDYDTLIKQLKIEQNKDEDLKVTSLFIIIGLGSFKSKLEEANLKMFDKVFSSIDSYTKNKYIIIDNYTSYKFLENEPWFRKCINQESGIWLGDNVSTQLSIKVPNLSINDRKIMFNEIGYVVKDSNHTIVRYVVDEEVDNEK